MGVPTFYRWLCNRYPRVPKDVVDNYNERNLDLADTDAVGLDLLCPNPNGEFDNLYLDMNGIIHPCCHPENMEQPESEEVMFKCILDYIDRIFYIVRPRKLIYLAIDGVAPRAKINQQRSRRFKSAAMADLEDETYDKLLKEYLEKRNDMEMPVRKNRWDSNVITPGTEFMYKLSKRLVEYIRDRVETYDAWKRIVVIFSDSNVPGEGEHKIMNFIRSQRHCPDYNPNTTHVLHGMDADLIMLGLATHEPNFFIIREIVTFFVNPSNKTVIADLESTLNPENNVVAKPGNLSKEQRYMKMMRENWKPLQLLQLSVLREYLSYQLKFIAGFDNGEFIDFERCLDDLVLMIFFCGNDFLPNLPSISITGGSIDQMILLYQKLLPSLNDYLSDEGNLNFQAISTFFGYLSKIEDETFKQIHEYKLKSQSYHQNRAKEAAARENRDAADKDGEGKDGKSADKNGSEDPESAVKPRDEVEKEFMERYKQEMEKLKAVDDVKPAVDVTLNDPRLWKEAYYREKFNLTGEDDMDAFVLELSFNYIKGICWVLQYYYQGCPSWSWYYPYHYSPFCSDLKFSNLCSMEATENGTDGPEGVESQGTEKRKLDSLTHIKFSLDTPLTPFQQLMGVMPIRSSHCLPKKLRVLMTDPDSPLKDFYPLKFTEDPNGKRYKYQWVALLPFIDEEKLLSHVVPIEEQLTDEEKFRNRTSQHMIFLAPPNRTTFLNQVNQLLTLPDKSDMDGVGQTKGLEYFKYKCDKKHKSVLLKGARIPPKVLTVQDVMEEQRNRGFNCEAAKRMILNMLSANRDRNRDPYGSGQSEAVLRDTARDYHQYHNQYDPGRYSGPRHNNYGPDSYHAPYPNSVYPRPPATQPPPPGSYPNRYPPNIYPNTYLSGQPIPPPPKYQNQHGTYGSAPGYPTQRSSYHAPASHYQGHRDSSYGAHYTQDYGRQSRGEPPYSGYEGHSHHNRSYHSQGYPGDRQYHDKRPYPHGRGSGNPPLKRSYNEKSLERLCKLVMKGEPGSPGDGKGRIESTYKSDYTVKEMPERIQRKVESVGSTFPLESMTTYNQDYREIEMPQIERRPRKEEHLQLPFEGVSTYTTDYTLKAWEYFIKRSDMGGM